MVGRVHRDAADLHLRAHLEAGVDVLVRRAARERNERLLLKLADQLRGLDGVRVPHPIRRARLHDAALVHIDEGDELLEVRDRQRAGRVERRRAEVRVGRAGEVLPRARGGVVLVVRDALKGRSRRGAVALDDDDVASDGPGGERGDDDGVVHLVDRHHRERAARERLAGVLHVVDVVDAHALLVERGREGEGGAGDAARRDGREDAVAGTLDVAIRHRVPLIHRVLHLLGEEVQDRLLVGVRQHRNAGGELRRDEPLDGDRRGERGDVGRAGPVVALEVHVAVVAAGAHHERLTEGTRGRGELLAPTEQHHGRVARLEHLRDDRVDGLQKDGLNLG